MTLYQSQMRNSGEEKLLQEPPWHLYYKENAPITHHVFEKSIQLNKTWILANMSNMRIPDQAVKSHEGYTASGLRWGSTENPMKSAYLVAQGYANFCKMVLMVIIHSPCCHGMLDPEKI